MLLTSSEITFSVTTAFSGSGKSFEIEAVRTLQNEKFTVCTFFGKAAFKIKWTKLDSLLQLPIQGKRNGPLKSSALAKLQNDLKEIKHVIIDEFSAVGRKMLGWMNRYCKRATGRLTVPSGKSVNISYQANNWSCITRVLHVSQI